jgi:hypothetical protein
VRVEGTHFALTRTGTPSLLFSPGPLEKSRGDTQRSLLRNRVPENCHRGAVSSQLDFSPTFQVSEQPGGGTLVPPRQQWLLPILPGLELVNGVDAMSESGESLPSRWVMTDGNYGP